MSKIRSNTSIELELQALLLHHGTADLAADALIKKYEHEKLTLSEFEAIANFLMSCGFYSSFLGLVGRKLRDGSKIPWGHFSETLKLSQAPVEVEIKKSIIEGAAEQDAISHLSRSDFLDNVESTLFTQRKLRRQAFVDRYHQRRQAMLQEIDLLRSQGLHQEEEKALGRMSVFFPEDAEIAELRASLRERLALDIIAKKPVAKNNLFIPYHEPVDSETRQVLDQIYHSMVENLDHDSQELAEDFAIALLTWEDEAAALKILEQAPPTISGDWLKAEILLSARYFVELMNHLTWLEATYGADPECLFSVNYLRAQALWGLNQKNRAIEILQGMVVTRPQYRAAHSLLNQWKEDLHE